VANFDVRRDKVRRGKLFQVRRDQQGKWELPSGVTKGLVYGNHLKESVWLYGNHLKGSGIW